MVIAHLSDLHINTEVVDSHIRRTEALICSALEQGAEHFIITGDVSDNALQHDFRRLRDLLAKYKLLDPAKLSLVVGNHDIFGGVAKAEDIFTFPERCRTTDYLQNLYSFHNWFEEAFAGCVYRSSDGTGYPFAKKVGDCLLIGLNSIQEYSSLKNPFASNGLLDERQQNELRDIIMYFGEQVKHRIVMVHHHFNKIQLQSGGITHSLWQSIEKQTLKLKKKRPLFDLFASCRIDMVLHGHYHLSEEYERKGIRFMNAGASIKGNSKDFLTLNLLHPEEEGIRTDIQLLEFIGKKGRAKKAATVEEVPVTESILTEAVLSNAEPV